MPPQAAKQIALLCHLEHLSAYDQPQGASPTRRTYSLNLSLALGGLNTDQEIKEIGRYLMPWLAENVTTIKVFDGVAVRYASRTHPPRWRGRPVNSSELNQPYRALADALESDFGQTVKRPELFLWKGFEDSFTQTFRKETPAKPWDLMLGQVAQLPTPIPQLLNLSFIFSLSQAEGFDLSRTIYAAPVIRYGAVAGVPPAPSLPAVTLTPKPLPAPGTPPPITDFRGDIKRWEYEASPAIPNFPAFAYIKACSPQRKGAGAFLDLGSLWVKAPGGSTYGEDWRASLEDRLAGGFDLCSRIVERMNEIERAGTAAEKAQLAADLPTYRQMFLAALRDLAGIGVTPAPSGDSLLEYSLRRVNPDEYRDGIKSDDRKKILEGGLNAFPTVSKWGEFVRSKLSVVDKLNILAGSDDVNASLANSAAIAEFEQLFQAVLDPANLSTLVKAQWQKVIVDNDVTPRLKEDVKRALSLDLTQTDVRRSLALENVGRFWGAFVRSGLTDAAGRPAVKEKFTCFLLAYYLLRFGRDCKVLPGGIIPGCGGSQPDECDKFLADLKERYDEFKVGPPFVVGDNQKELFLKLFEYIGAWAGRFGQKLTPGALGSAGEENRPTETPHAVTIMVDELSADQSRTDAAAGPGADYDPLESISGVGLLMREAPGAARKEWRCLNLADVQVRNAADGYGHVFDPPLLVSYGLNYLNDLRQSFVSYNNHPLTARSPVAHLATRGNELKGDAAGEQQGHDFLTFNEYHKDAKLTPLKFGSVYEVLPFIIGNSGALPKELARVGSFDPAGDAFAPCDLDLDGFNQTFGGSLESAGPGVTDLRPYRRAFAYRRRVRVGQTRLFNATKQPPAAGGAQPATVGGTCLDIPVIPDDVFPRFRDLEQFVRKSSAEPKAGKDEQPLILLTGAGKWKRTAEEFSFLARLPSTDLNTWDRWVASNRIYGADLNAATVKELRKKVWERYHRHLNENQDSGPRARCLPPNFDATLDDPALARKFRVELFRLDKGAFVPVPNGSTVVEVGGPNIVVGPATPADEAYRQMQAFPLKVICKVDAAAGAVAGLKEQQNPAPGPGNPKSLLATVKEGEIYRLKISCLLPKADYPDSATAPRRFAAIYGGLDEGGKFFPGLDEDGLYYKVSPFEMFIEVAKGKPDITEGDLLAALLPGLVNENGDVLAVNLNNREFLYVHKIELQRQMWRWQGRDTKPYPAVAPARADWESVEYGGRDENDHTVVEMSAEKTAAGTRRFVYKERLTGRNSDGKQVKEERRALHYRFRAKAYSRYAGILPDGEASVETPKAVWKSLYVPCRLDRKLTVPKVRFVFPLTQSFGAGDPGSESAGLLVVLSECWFEDAGIGEGLGVEVTTALDPDVPAPAPGAPTPAPGAPQKVYFEMGPDPLNTGKAMPLFGVDGVAARFGGIRGPVGHTFDTVGDFPLFTSTSFIIPAPYLDKTGVAPSRLPGWGMCEIKFRRVLNSNDKPNLESEFTDPYWVQFLPEFTRFSDNDIDPSRHALRVTRLPNDRHELQFVEKSSQKVVGLRATPSSDYTAYELYVFVTGQVFDVMGRPGQEVFVGLATPKGDGKTWSIDRKFGAQQAERLRARIVEVQYRKNSGVVLSTADQMWQALFDKNIADQKRARIVRVSEPLDV